MHAEKMQPILMASVATTARVHGSGYLKCSRREKKHLRRWSVSDVAVIGQCSVALVADLVFLHYTVVC